MCDCCGYHVCRCFRTQNYQRVHVHVYVNMCACVQMLLRMLRPTRMVMSAAHWLMLRGEEACGHTLLRIDLCTLTVGTYLIVRVTFARIQTHVCSHSCLAVQIFADAVMCVTLKVKSTYSRRYRVATNARIHPDIGKYTRK